MSSTASACSVAALLATSFRFCSSSPSWCSSTSSAISWWRAAAGCESWCSRSVLALNCVGFNDRHGTRWKISAIPLGGYVKFFGDENAASAPDQARGRGHDRRRSAGTASSISRSAQRAAIVAAGPIANFILAIVIFAAIFALYGKQTTTARVDAVQPDSRGRGRGLPARRRGAGDRRRRRSAASPTCSASSAPTPAALWNSRSIAAVPR